MRGLGPVPWRTGKSPDYLLRQLLGMKSGPGAGKWTKRMGPVVAGLNLDGMLSAADYLGSLRP